MRLENLNLMIPKQSLVHITSTVLVGLNEELEEFPSDLVFVPLGGTEEIGMNFNLYGLRSGNHEDWIIVDLGITFGDDTMPGVEIVVPDASFAQEKR